MSVEVNSLIKNIFVVDSIGKSRFVKWDGDSVGANKARHGKGGRATKLRAGHCFEGFTD